MGITTNCLNSGLRNLDQDQIWTELME